jgi:hypothetical protein
MIAASRCSVLLSAGAFWLVAAVANAADSRPASGFGFEDYLLAPVRVHLLTATNSTRIHTTLAEKDIARILGKVSGVWSQAGLSFYVESLVREEATNQDFGAVLGKAGDLSGLLRLRPEASKAPDMFHIYYIKELSVNGVYLKEAMFVKDTASLKEVEGGIDEPVPRVTSHELGHALTLQHCQTPTHLMFRGTTGTNLDEGEVQQAREAARKFQWIEPATVIMQKADELYRASKIQEAKVLYARLAAVPVKAEQVKWAAQRAK